MSTGHNVSQKKDEEEREEISLSLATLFFLLSLNHWILQSSGQAASWLCVDRNECVCVCSCACVRVSWFALLLFFSFFFFFFFCLFFLTHLLKHRFPGRTRAVINTQLRLNFSSTSVSLRPVKSFDFYFDRFALLEICLRTNDSNTRPATKATPPSTSLSSHSNNDARHEWQVHDWTDDHSEYPYSTRQ